MEHRLTTRVCHRTTYRDAKDGMVHRMMHVGRHHVWDCMWHWFFLHLFLYRYLFLRCCWTIWHHLRLFFLYILFHILFYFIGFVHRYRIVHLYMLCSVT